jgi:phosphoglycolate phosphatase
MINAVLFDLDGTLLDTAPDLLAALNHVRHSEGLDGLSEEGFRHHVSRGAVGIISAGMPAADSGRFELRKQLFLTHYRDNLYVKTRPFNGVIELLAALDARAIPWGVVTNKTESLTHPLLRAAGLFSRAACVVCGDTVEQCKPHPAPVLLGCEILKIAPMNTLLVGDDLRDLEAGRAAGTEIALAAYGYLAPDTDHRAYAGSHRISHPKDVLDLVMQAGVSG